MRIALAAATLAAGILVAGSALAACEGSNGRGWGSGKGAGKFQMRAADKSCQISFPNFINDQANTQIPATDVALTRAPKSGKLGISARGPVYTPNAGFKGEDKFCIRATTPKVKGKSLSGCITVTVR